MTLNLYVSFFPSRVTLLTECSVSLGGGMMGALDAILEVGTRGVLPGAIFIQVSSSLMRR